MSREKSPYIAARLSADWTKGEQKKSLPARRLSMFKTLYRCPRTVARQSTPRRPTHARHRREPGLCERCYKQLRDKIYAHKDRTDISGFVAKTNTQELGRLVSDLRILHGVLWHWLRNGRRPRISPATLGWQTDKAGHRKVLENSHFPQVAQPARGVWLSSSDNPSLGISAAERCGSREGL